MEFLYKLAFMMGTGLAAGLVTALRLAGQKQKEGPPNDESDALLRSALDVLSRLPPPSPHRKEGPGEGGGGG